MNFATLLTPISAAKQSQVARPFRTRKPGDLKSYLRFALSALLVLPGLVVPAKTAVATPVPTQAGGVVTPTQKPLKAFPPINVRKAARQEALAPHRPHLPNSSPFTRRKASRPIAEKPPS